MSVLDELRAALDSLRAFHMAESRIEAAGALDEAADRLDTFAAEHPVIEGCLSSECALRDQGGIHCLLGASLTDFGCTLGRPVMAARKEP